MSAIVNYRPSFQLQLMLLPLKFSKFMTIIKLSRFPIIVVITDLDDLDLLFMLFFCKKSISNIFNKLKYNYLSYYN